MNAPRVLVSGLALAQPMSGVRRHAQELFPRVAALLARDGGRLSILAPRAGLPFELPSTVEVLRSNLRAPGPFKRLVFETRALAKRLAKAQVRFEVVNTGHLPAPRNLEVPFTLTLHDLKGPNLAYPSLGRRIWAPHVIRSAVARAAAVIVVSDTLRDEVVTLTGCDPAKFHVVPNGCDHLPLVERATANPPFLLYVGHLERRKNVELLLLALEADPELPRLVLAGAPRDGYDESLRALASKLGVTERVEILGLCDDARLAHLYATCACVVLPSLREGFDIPIVEAQRAGAPLAVSRLPVHIEIAGAAVSSFDSFDPHDCARAIRAALVPSVPRTGATWDDAAALWVAAHVAARQRTSA